MIVRIDTIASDNGGQMGIGGWVVEEEEYTVCTKRYVRWQIRECQVIAGRGGVYICRGMTNVMFYDNGDSDGG